MPTSARKLSPCHFLHSFNKCLLSVSQCVFAYVQMSFPDTRLPASMSVQLLLCVQNLGSFHTCPHLFTLCILTHLFILATPFTLSALIRSCLYLSISVLTCLDWTHLFTPAHSGPHLSSFAHIHAPCLCSHLPVLALRTCPYILPHLRTCDLTLVRGNLGALRLKVRLVEDRVLPSKYYQPLVQLLMESVLGLPEVGVSGKQLPGDRVGHADLVLASPGFQGTSLGSSASGSQNPRPPYLPPVLAQEDDASPLAVLELTSGDCRQDLATKLVKLFLGQGLAGPFLDYLTRREVARTSELPE